MNIKELRKWLMNNTKFVLVNKIVQNYNTVSNLMKLIKKSMLYHSKLYNKNNDYDFKYFLRDIEINYKCDDDDVKLIPIYIDDENNLCCEIYVFNKSVEFYRISLNELS